MPRRLAWLLAILLLLALEASAQEPPRFFIERIDVLEIERVSAGVIKSESRLREGRSYGEDELRDANDRLRRLPFVLDATFALQKGSERDRYVLAITVSEAKPLFYLFDAVFYPGGNNEALFDPNNDAVLGGRWFAGSRGAFHVGLLGRDPQRPFTRGYGVFQAGYTHYDLFGTGAFVTVAVSQQILSSPQSSGVPEVVIAVPLSSKQTLTASYTGNDIGDDRERVLESRWSYNTTNHPFFPTRGTVLSAGPVFATTEASFIVSPTGPRVFTENRAAGFEFEGKKHWEISATSSLSAEVLAGAAQIDRRRDDVSSRFAQGYGRGLLRLSRTISSSDVSQSRLELTFRVAGSGSDPRRQASDGVTQLSVSVARRSPWGAVRFGVGYTW